MLTAGQIREIAEYHGLPLVNHWASTSKGSEPPVLKSLSISFGTPPQPEAWQLLMVNLTEVPVDISGTRPRVHDTLDPAYSALLPEVNELRAKVGLQPVCR